MRGWEPDNNWNVSYSLRNWKGLEWSYNRTLYPSGGEGPGGFVAKLGNLAMTYYTNGFADKFVSAFLLEQGRLKPTIRRLCARFVEAGNPLCMMTRVFMGWWKKLTEELVSTRAAQGQIAELLSTSLGHGECAP